MKYRIFLIIFIPLAAWGVIQDMANTARGGSIDLRNRITGARIAAAKIDPYSYKWMDGSPEEFCDPFNEPGALLSKTTVTPWVLAAHTPFISLNYQNTQWLWFFIQYGAGALGLIAWTSRQSGDRVKWGIVLALIFSLSPSWRQHVDHGQIYVVFAAMLLFLYWLNHQKSSPKAALAEGLFCAWFLGSRPIFLGQFAGPIQKRNRLSLCAAVVGIVMVSVIPIFLFGTAIWNHYGEAMEAHSEIYLLQMRPGRVLVHYPPTIEGIPIDILAGVSKKIPFADTSLFRNISFLLPPRGLLALWVLLMGFSLLYLMKKKATHDLLWWSVASWIVVGDFLLPAYRHPYNDVLAIPMFLFGISALQNHPFQKTWIYTCLSILFLMWLSWQIPPAWKWYFPLPSLALGVMGLVAGIYAVRLSRSETRLTGRDI